MSKIKMVETLVAATGKPQEAHAFMKAWEEDERAREIKYEKTHHSDCTGTMRNSLQAFNGNWPYKVRSCLYSVSS